MATLGALAATIEQVEAETQATGETLKEHATSTAHSHDAGVTHHYKRTETHTVETEQRDDVSANERQTEDSKKHNKCGCFGFLRLRKK